MIFSNKKIDKSDAYIKNDQKLIKHAKWKKFFIGGQLDSHLQWKDHVNCVNLKI